MGDLTEPVHRLAGAQTALANAQALMREAEILAAHQAYGRGISLLILGAEEAAKAMTLHVRAVASELPGNWDQVFYSHKAKQNVLYFGSILASLFAEVRPEIEAAVDGLRERFGPLDNSPPVEAMHEFLEAYFADPARHQRLAAAAKVAEAQAAWWKEADGKKQRGLYITFRFDRWQSPLDVTKAEYQQVRERVESHIRQIEGWVGRPSPAGLPADPAEALRLLATMLGLVWLMEGEE